MTPTFDQAMKMHRSGRFQEAERLYRQILDLAPDHPAANHYLGLLAHQSGDHESAIRMMLRSIELDPTAVDFHNNLALVYQTAGQPQAAIDMLRKALSLNPGSTDSLNNLGMALLLRGELDEAEKLLRSAIGARPPSGSSGATMLSNLGQLLHARGRSDKAIEAFEQALAADPKHMRAHYGLGLALRTSGRLAEAEQHQREVLRLSPLFPEAMNELGVTLSWLQRLPEAIEQFERAIALSPQRASYFSNLGNALCEAGRFEQALAFCRRAVELDPATPQAHANLANALMRMGEVEEAIVEFREAWKLDPENSAMGSNVLFALHSDPSIGPEALLAEHVRWTQRLSHRNPEESNRLAHGIDRTADRPLRIGYVSPDFRNHSVGQFFAPIIEGHDPKDFEVYCYSNSFVKDATTERIRARAAAWRDIRKIQDEPVARIIHDDRIDILVDLAVHSADNRLPLFALKPAPVQMSYLGYPGTTGLSEIDFKITDQYIDPPGTSEQFHTEQLARLAHCYFCYPMPVRSPAVGPLPATTRGHVTFASFNSFAKVNKRVLSLWARLLAGMPKARILLASGAVHSPQFEQRIRTVFEEAGVNGECVELIAAMEFPAYLQRHNEVDILLDPFPFNGGTTSCHALWMGVPLVTMVGSQGVSRMGSSFLHNLDLPNLIAGSEDEYVKIASDLARDIDGLVTIRATLRDRMRGSPIMNAPEAVRDLESIYRRAWASYCNS